MDNPDDNTNNSGRGVDLPVFPESIPLQQQVVQVFQHANDSVEEKDAEAYKPIDWDLTNKAPSATRLVSAQEKTSVSVVARLISEKLSSSEEAIVAEGLEDALSFLTQTPSSALTSKVRDQLHAALDFLDDDSDSEEDGSEEDASLSDNDDGDNAGLGRATKPSQRSIIERVRVLLDCGSTADSLVPTTGEDTARHTPLDMLRNTFDILLDPKGTVESSLLIESPVSTQGLLRDTKALLSATAGTAILYGTSPLPALGKGAADKRYSATLTLYDAESPSDFGALVPAAVAETTADATGSMGSMGSMGPIAHMTTTSDSPPSILARFVDDVPGTLHILNKSATAVVATITQGQPPAVGNSCVAAVATGSATRDQNARLLGEKLLALIPSKVSSFAAVTQDASGALRVHCYMLAAAAPGSDSTADHANQELSFYEQSSFSVSLHKCACSIFRHDSGAISEETLEFWPKKVVPMADEFLYLTESGQLLDSRNQEAAYSLHAPGKLSDIRFNADASSALGFVDHLPFVLKQPKYSYVSNVKLHTKPLPYDDIMDVAFFGDDAMVVAKNDGRITVDGALPCEGLFVPLFDFVLSETAGVFAPQPGVKNLSLAVTDTTTLHIRRVEVKNATTVCVSCAITGKWSVDVADLVSLQMNSPLQATFSTTTEGSSAVIISATLPAKGIEPNAIVAICAKGSATIPLLQTQVMPVTYGPQPTTSTSTHSWALPNQTTDGCFSWSWNVTGATPVTFSYKVSSATYEVALTNQIPAGVHHPLERAIVTARFVRVSAGPCYFEVIVMPPTQEFLEHKKHLLKDVCKRTTSYHLPVGSALTGTMSVSASTSGEALPISNVILPSNPFFLRRPSAHARPSISLPDGDRPISLVAGSHHALVATQQGRLLSIGSNAFGQCGRSFAHRGMRLRKGKCDGEVHQIYASEFRNVCRACARYRIEPSKERSKWYAFRPDYSGLKLPTSGCVRCHRCVDCCDSGALDVDHFLDSLDMQLGLGFVDLDGALSRASKHKSDHSLSDPEGSPTAATTTATTTTTTTATTTTTTTTAALAGSSSVIVQVAAGTFHSAILLSTGEVRTCGLNNGGQLCRETQTLPHSLPFASCQFLAIERPNALVGPIIHLDARGDALLLVSEGCFVAIAGNYLQTKCISLAEYTRLKAPLKKMPATVQVALGHDKSYIIMEKNEITSLQSRGAASQHGKNVARSLENSRTEADDGNSALGLDGSFLSAPKPKQQQQLQQQQHFPSPLGRSVSSVAKDGAKRSNGNDDDDDDDDHDDDDNDGISKAASTSKMQGGNRQAGKDASDGAYSRSILGLSSSQVIGAVYDGFCLLLLKLPPSLQEPATLPSMLIVRSLPGASAEYQHMAPLAWNSFTPACFSPSAPLLMGWVTKSTGTQSPAAESMPSADVGISGFQIHRLRLGSALQSLFVEGASQNQQYSHIIEKMAACVYDPFLLSDKCSSLQSWVAGVMLKLASSLPRLRRTSFRKAAETFSDSRNHNCSKQYYFDMRVDVPCILKNIKHAGVVTISAQTGASNKNLLLQPGVWYRCHVVFKQMASMRAKSLSCSSHIRAKTASKIGLRLKPRDCGCPAFSTCNCVLHGIEQIDLVPLSTLELQAFSITAAEPFADSVDAADTLVADLLNSARDLSSMLRGMVQRLTHEASDGRPAERDQLQLLFQNTTKVRLALVKLSFLFSSCEKAYHAVGERVAEQLRASCNALATLREAYPPVLAPVLQTCLEDAVFMHVNFTPTAHLAEDAVKRLDTLFGEEVRQTASRTAEATAVPRKAAMARAELDVLAAIVHTCWAKLTPSQLFDVLKSTLSPTRDGKASSSKSQSRGAKSTETSASDASSDSKQSMAEGKGKDKDKGKVKAGSKPDENAADEATAVENSDAAESKDEVPVATSVIGLLIAFSKAVSNIQSHHFVFETVARTLVAAHQLYLSSILTSQKFVQDVLGALSLCMDHVATELKTLYGVSSHPFTRIVFPAVLRLCTPSSSNHIVKYSSPHFQRLFAIYKQIVGQNQTVASETYLSGAPTLQQEEYVDASVFGKAVTVDSPHPYTGGQVYNQTVSFESPADTLVAIGFHDCCSLGGPDDRFTIHAVDGEGEKTAIVSVKKPKPFPTNFVLAKGNKFVISLSASSREGNAADNMSFGYRLQFISYPSKSSLSAFSGTPTAAIAPASSRLQSGSDQRTGADEDAEEASAPTDCLGSPRDMKARHALEVATATALSSICKSELKTKLREEGEGVVVVPLTFESGFKGKNIKLTSAGSKSPQLLTHAERTDGFKYGCTFSRFPLAAIDGRKEFKITITQTNSMNGGTAIGFMIDKRVKKDEKDDSEDSTPTKRPFEKKFGVPRASAIMTNERCLVYCTTSEAFCGSEDLGSISSIENPITLNKPKKNEEVRMWVTEQNEMFIQGQKQKTPVKIRTASKVAFSFDDDIYAFVDVYGGTKAVKLEGKAQVTTNVKASAVHCRACRVEMVQTKGFGSATCECQAEIPVAASYYLCPSCLTTRCMACAKYGTTSMFKSAGSLRKLAASLTTSGATSTLSTKVDHGLLTWRLVIPQDCQDYLVGVYAPKFSRNTTKSPFGTFINLKTNELIHGHRTLAPWPAPKAAKKDSGDDGADKKDGDNEDADGDGGNSKGKPRILSFFLDCDSHTLNISEMNGESVTLQTVQSAQPCVFSLAGTSKKFADRGGVLQYILWSAAEPDDEDVAHKSCKLVQQRLSKTSGSDGADGADGDADNALAASAEEYKRFTKGFVEYTGSSHGAELAKVLLDSSRGSTLADVYACRYDALKTPALLSSSFAEAEVLSAKENGHTQPDAVSAEVVAKRVDPPSRLQQKACRALLQAFWWHHDERDRVLNEVAQHLLAPDQPKLVSPQEVLQSEKNAAEVLSASAEPDTACVFEFLGALMRARLAAHTLAPTDRKGLVAEVLIPGASVSKGLVVHDPSTYKSCVAVPAIISESISLTAIIDTDVVDANHKPVSPAVAEAWKVYPVGYAHENGILMSFPSLPEGASWADYLALTKQMPLTACMLDPEPTPLVELEVFPGLGFSSFRCMVPREDVHHTRPGLATPRPLASIADAADLVLAHLSLLGVSSQTQLQAVVDVCYELLNYEPALMSNSLESMNVPIHPAPGSALDVVESFGSDLVAGSVSQLMRQTSEPLSPRRPLLRRVTSIEYSATAPDDAKALPAATASIGQVDFQSLSGFVDDVLDLVNLVRPKKKAADWEVLFTAERKKGDTSWQPVKTLNEILLTTTSFSVVALVLNLFTAAFQTPAKASSYYEDEGDDMAIESSHDPSDGPEESGKAGGSRKKAHASDESVNTIHVLDISLGLQFRASRILLIEFLRIVANFGSQLPPNHPLQRLAIRCWTLPKVAELEPMLLQHANVFPWLSRLLLLDPRTGSASPSKRRGRGDRATSSNAIEGAYSLDITEFVTVHVSSRPDMAASLTDGKTDTMWQSEKAYHDHYINLAVDEARLLKELSQPATISQVFVHFDGSKDTLQKLPSTVVLRDTSDVSFNKPITHKVSTVSAAQWLTFDCHDMKSNSLKIILKGAPEVRVRQVRVCTERSMPVPTQEGATVNSIHLDALSVFKLLSSALLKAPVASGSQAQLASAPSARGDGDGLMGILSQHSGQAQAGPLQSQMLKHVIRGLKVETADVVDRCCNAPSGSSGLLVQGKPAADAADEADLYGGEQNVKYLLELLDLLRTTLSHGSLGKSETTVRKLLYQQLHCGSPVIQSEVIDILRRLTGSSSPSSASGAALVISKSEDASALAATTVSSTTATTATTTTATNVAVSTPSKPATAATGTPRQADRFKRSALLFAGPSASRVKVTSFTGQQVDIPHSHVLLSCVAKLLHVQVRMKLQEGSSHTEQHQVSLKELCGLSLTGSSVTGSQATGALQASTATTSSVGPLVRQASMGLSRQASVSLEDTDATTYQRISLQLKKQFAPWQIAGDCAPSLQEIKALFASLLNDPSVGPALVNEVSALLFETAQKAQTMDASSEACLHFFAESKTWLALAALAVITGESVMTVNTFLRQKAGNLCLCQHHGDGHTVADVYCEDCGLHLCSYCDRFAHLKKSSENHTRAPLEGLDSLTVESNDGFTRIKQGNFMLLVDPAHLRCIAEFKPQRRAEAGELLCRFCEAPVQQTQAQQKDGGSVVCDSFECQDAAENICTKTLPCGHACQGVKDEKECLPCLTCGKTSGTMQQDIDDECMICFCGSLRQSPCVSLACKHVFHYECVEGMLRARWPGARITFDFAKCPLCRTSILTSTETPSPILAPLLQPIRDLYKDVKRKALMRLQYDNADFTGTDDEKTAHAMEKYTYYQCFKCRKAYFGGEAVCAIASDFNEEELICPACTGGKTQQVCPKHGTDFLEYKCRYCCSVAVFFCFGTTHFCHPCHDAYQRCLDTPKAKLPKCPCGPKLVQLEGDECPLHVKHPPTGEEFALGCGICRNAQTF